MFQGIWGDKHACFYMTDKNRARSGVKIMGNIYEHPDLLTNEK